MPNAFRLRRRLRQSRFKHACMHVRVGIGPRPSLRPGLAITSIARKWSRMPAFYIWAQGWTNVARTLSSCYNRRRLAVRICVRSSVAVAALQVCISRRRRRRKTNWKRRRAAPLRRRFLTAY